MTWWQQVLLGSAVVGAVVGVCYLLVWLLCRMPADRDETVGVLEPDLEPESNPALYWEHWEALASGDSAAINATRERLNGVFGTYPTVPFRPQPSFVVAARLVGGMGDGEEVEVHSQLWLAHPPTELRVTARDETSNPPVVHHLLYRVSPEDSQVFVFAGVVPAPHELMGD